MLFAQRQRYELMGRLKSMFIEADKINVGINKEKLISKICFENGATRRKAQEYIKQLLDAEYIEEDNYGLWLKDKSYKAQEIELNSEEEQILNENGVREEINHQNEEIKEEEII